LQDGECQEEGQEEEPASPIAPSCAAPRLTLPPPPSPLLVQPWMQLLDASSGCCRLFGQKPCRVSEEELRKKRKKEKAYTCEGAQQEDLQQTINTVMENGTAISEHLYDVFYGRMCGGLLTEASGSDPKSYHHTDSAHGRISHDVQGFPSRPQEVQLVGQGPSSPGHCHQHDKAQKSSVKLGKKLKSYIDFSYKKKYSTTQSDEEPKPITCSLFYRDI
jgi:hypothetical protein